MGVAWGCGLTGSASSSLAGRVFERRGGEVLGQRLAEQLEEAYGSASCVDLKALCVIPGEQCWILYVDTLGGGGRGVANMLLVVCVYRCWRWVGVCWMLCLLV